MTPSTPSIRAIVARHAEATADNRVFFHPDIPEHRLVSALAVYPGIVPEDALVLLDNTDSGDATEGLLLTEAAIHACSSAGLVQRLPLAKLRTVDFAAASPPVLRLNGIAVLTGVRVRPETMGRVVDMLREIAGDLDGASATPSEVVPEASGATDEACGQTTTVGETSPDEAPSAPVALWNPEAAAILSLFFSPMFGACLHALNWQALGNARLFKASLLWMLPGIVLPFVAGALLPVWLAASLGVAYLGAWYLFAAAGQARHVRETLGDVYVRRGWVPPVVCALVALTLVLFAVGAMAEFRHAGHGSSSFPSLEMKTEQQLLEEQAAGMVSRIIARDTPYGYEPPKCIRVRITEEIVDGFYRATATLDTGRDVPMTIKYENDTIEVRMEL